MSVQGGHQEAKKAEQEIEDQTQHRHDKSEDSDSDSRDENEMDKGKESALSMEGLEEALPGVHPK